MKELKLPCTGGAEGRKQKVFHLRQQFRFGGRGGSDTVKSIPNLMKPAGESLAAG